VLTHLQLRDFVIVDAADLEFGAGLTALTGETGAGKSVVVDALSMLAGGRITGDIVRHGAERAEATAGFSALPVAAVAWLDSFGVDHEGEVLVRRIVGTDGRSRAYLNGQLVPVQALREFAELLIEIHGQQEFQHLVKRDAQRELLDLHGATGEPAATVAAIHARYQDCRRRLDSLETAAQGRHARLELLRYQLSELRAEVTTAADIEALFVERKRVAGRGRLAGAAQNALMAIYDADGDNAQSLLARAQTALRSPGDADPALAAAGKLLDEATINVQEAADTLRRFLDALDTDPQRQEEIERRAASLEALARKHRLAVQELPQQMAHLDAELKTLENSVASAAELEQSIDLLTRDYHAAAALLTAARRAAAVDLGAQITGLMQSLGMQGGRFAVAVEPGTAAIGANGSDAIEFLVSANPGQAPKSLAKVASGGELSRISLAVQVAAAAKAAAVCMVFDEVDSGIGGAVAEIVGRQLRELGSRGQVLCVTHLPQVASQAQTQFRVSKQNDANGTRTTIKRLDSDERVDEIARMLGGVDVTSEAVAHAREMLARSSVRTGARAKATRRGAP
jgi:DNA repair protein RecN (Recombination protein N)